MASLFTSHRNNYNPVERGRQTYPGIDSNHNGPHPTKTLLRDATNCWMSNAHLTQYQALHLDKDRLTFDECMTINPATLFLDNYPEDASITGDA